MSDSQYPFESRLMNRLDEIIKLLKYMKAHHHIQLVPEGHLPSETKESVFVGLGNDTGKVCNCDSFVPGQLTGGWFCPIHGQCS